MLYPKIDLKHLGFLQEELEKLKQISKKLHRLHEITCTYGLTIRQDKRYKQLKKNAQTIAKSLGYNAYVQTDPCGCALYLVSEEWTKEYVNIYHCRHCMPIY